MYEVLGNFFADKAVLNSIILLFGLSCAFLLNYLLTKKGK